MNRMFPASVTLEERYQEFEEKSDRLLWLQISEKYKVKSENNYSSGPDFIIARLWVGTCIPRTAIIIVFLPKSK